MKKLSLVLIAISISCSTPALIVDPPSDAILEVDLRNVRFKFQPQPPPYPPEAKAAKIQGAVSVTLVVDKDGKVISATAISGPQSLRKCAEEYFTAHRFYPFVKNGAARIIKFVIIAPFRLK